MAWYWYCLTVWGLSTTSTWWLPVRPASCCSVFSAVQQISNILAWLTINLRLSVSSVVTLPSRLPQVELPPTTRLVRENPPVFHHHFPDTQPWLDFTSGQAGQDGTAAHRWLRPSVSTILSLLEIAETNTGASFLQFRLLQVCCGGERGDRLTSHINRLVGHNIQQLIVQFYRLPYLVLFC